MRPQIIFKSESSGLAQTVESKHYDNRTYPQSSKSGWQVTDTWWPWMFYIAELLHQYIPGKHVIVIDSYAVHFSEHECVQKLVDKYEVHLYPMVPNATQYMQPMDQYVIPAWKGRVKR